MMISRFSLLFCFLLLTNFGYATSHKSIWPKWEMNNPLSQKTISHKAWQDFLDRNVITNEEGINLVDYHNLPSQDLEQLNQYINTLSNVDINQYSRNEQLAYWINLYNAIVVRTVANYFPIASIQEVNISPGLFSIGPWGANLVTVNGTQLTLDQIQDRIIRPIWNDPRALYALSDGTVGGANLSKQAYLGASLETQLNEAALTYINSLRGAQFIENRLIVSKIYEWYLDDFGDTETDIIQHLLVYAKEPLRTQLQQAQGIDSYIYNWHLNSTLTQRS